MVAPSSDSQGADGGEAADEQDVYKDAGSTHDLAHATEPECATLEGAALGEFAMHVHSYLLLLDFSSPPLPAKECDAIHAELQALLQNGPLTVAQQAALLHSVKERHAALRKSLQAEKEEAVKREGRRVAAEAEANAFVPPKQVCRQYMQKYPKGCRFGDNCRGHHYQPK